MLKQRCSICSFIRDSQYCFVFKFSVLVHSSTQTDEKLECDRGDVVEIDTWVDAAGKNGMRRDWIIRDFHTQEIITRASRCSIFRLQPPPRV